MLQKTVKVGDKEVAFRSSATIPRLYRIKFKRDIFKDLSKLEQSYKSPVESANKQYEKSYLVKHNYRYRPSIKRECVDFISHTHSFSIVTAKKSIILVENAQKKRKIRINNQKYHKTIKI